MLAIIGATGKTGRAALGALRAAGHAVRAVARDPDKARALGEAGADVGVAKLDDARALERALEGVTALYAVLPEDPLAPAFHAPRVRMADALAAAVRARGVEHVVFLSALPAALSEGNGPAKDLHYAEQALRQTGTRVTTLRASYFQDNVLGLVAPARAEGIYPCFLPSADVAFPTVAARDVGALAARALASPPPASEVVDVLGPAYSTRQLADGLASALGRPLRVVEIPPEAHVDVLGRAGVSRQFAEALAEMFACFASGRVRPEGDRVEHGTTSLEAVLREGLRER